MNKIMRSFIALFLAVAMCFTLGTSAFAAEPIYEARMNEVLKMPDNSYVLHDKVSNITIKGYDLPNGDCVFERFAGTEMTSSYTVKRNQGIINANYYNAGSVTSETISVPVAVETQNNTSRVTTTGYMGRIRYQYTSGDQSGICGARVNYTKNTGNKKYNINGTYQDLAALAGILALVFSFGSGVALGVAKKVVALIGGGATLSPIFIPDVELDSTYEEIEYDLTDINSSTHTNSFYGTKYIVSEPGLHYNEVYTEGDYYPTTSWGNYNFGTTIYNHMFSYSFWSIYSWN